MVAHILPLLVVSAGIGVSARALPVAQGVTDAIAPSAAIPPSCSLSAPNTYGLSISPASGATPLRKRQAVSQIPDGQLQATANVANVIEPQTPQQFEPGCGYVTQIIDGQIQVLGGCPPTVQTFPKYPTPNIPAPKVPTPHIPVPKVPTPMVPSSVIKIEGGQIQVPQVSVAAAAASVPQSVGTANYAPSSVTQIGDGQIQAPQALAAVNAASIPQPVVGQMANYAPSGVTQLAEGQIQVPQAPAAVAPASSVTQIEDGQIQAPQAPAAVNAASIPQPVVGQMANYAPSGVTQLAEGQIQVPQVSAAAASVPQSVGAANYAPSGVTQIEDGQIQAPQAPAAVNAARILQPVVGQMANYAPSGVAQIKDGQIQVPQVPTVVVPTSGVTQIEDGQIQAPATVNAASIPQPVVGQKANYAPSGVTQLAEGQIQVPQAPAVVTPASGVTQIEDGQIQAPQAPAAVNAASIPQPVVGQMANYATSGVTQLAEGQIQVPQVPQVSAAAEAASVPQSIAVQEATSSEVPQPPAPSSTPIEPASGVAPSAPVAQIAGGKIQARQNGDLLGVTLNNGVLTDRLGRTGYIASNRQLQFDAPAQAGAIYTAGFSACDDGTLGLGASNVFYACGSSDFNNIYDQSIYPDNCNPVHLRLRE